MQLARFPRRRYTPGPTPLEPLPHLSRHLGTNVYVKRDDLLGLSAGGNKTRKLEFLVADALEEGADTLVTVGAVQSNHCRLTLAAAVKEGLKCRLVLEERVPGSYRADASGNNFLFGLLGVERIKVVNLGEDLDAAMREIADELAQEGRKGYLIPGGGSNALGALGYVACAEEILFQTFELGLRLDHLVCASGSAGTHAGLLVGMTGSHAQLPITGINVRRPREEQEANVHALAQRTSDLLGLPHGIPPEDVVALDDWVGPGYSLPTDEMVHAVRLLARLEGILLDPVYTGKAMAGLIGLAERGAFKRDDNVLFLHTGGSPALYAYQGVLSD
ncbi:MAG: D-cysteine desulfhydrase [Deinococcota bacterium]|nr:D-cysteine desulfhydrase [Deinococcota bacterium]